MVVWISGVRCWPRVSAHAYLETPRSHIWIRLRLMKSLWSHLSAMTRIAALVFKKDYPSLVSVHAIHQRRPLHYVGADLSATCHFSETYSNKWTWNARRWKDQFHHGARHNARGPGWRRWREKLYLQNKQKPRKQLQICDQYKIVWHVMVTLNNIWQQIRQSKIP